MFVAICASLYAVAFAADTSKWVPASSYDDYLYIYNAATDASSTPDDLPSQMVNPKKHAAIVLKASAANQSATIGVYAGTKLVTQTTYTVGTTPVFVDLGSDRAGNYLNVSWTALTSSTVLTSDTLIFHR